MSFYEKVVQSEGLDFGRHCGFAAIQTAMSAAAARFQKQAQSFVRGLLTFS